MKIKTSSYTPVLLVGLLIVLIASNIFDPLQSDYFWQRMAEDSDMPVIVTKVILTLFMPIMMSSVDFYSYLAGSLEFSGENFSVLFCTALIVMGYLGISYYLEKFHLYWHSEEGTFTTCIDLLCIENIVMYIFNLVFYFITQAIMKLKISQEGWLIAIFIIALPALWAILFYLMYIFAGMMISMIVPACSIFFLEQYVSSGIATLIFIILLLLFSQVVWRFCLGKVYNRLLRIFSFGHFSLE